MKLILLAAFLLIVAGNLYSQQDTTKKLKQPLSQQDYFRKSGNQKVAAWIFVGAGTALVITGIALSDGSYTSLDDAFTGVGVAFLGVLTAGGSIPFFILSHKNKKRGNNASAFFKAENISVRQARGFVNSSFRRWP